MNFFYERSPYSDKGIGIYPVGRVTTDLNRSGTEKKLTGAKRMGRDKDKFLKSAFISFILVIN